MRLDWPNGDCHHCKAERSRRSRVLPLGSQRKIEFQREPSAITLAICNSNVPRYFAMLLRARESARHTGRRLTWCFARDVPLCVGDREFPRDQLNAKLKRWLGRHDQGTAHLASILPLVQGLPVRLTESIDRRRKLYRGRRGVIFGWALREQEEPLKLDNELSLPHLLRLIYVQFPGATWDRISDDFPADVFPVSFASRIRKVNTFTGISARRSDIISYLILVPPPI